MKITMITGSPHRTGTSAALADSFEKGARSAGHQVFRFEAALRSVNPCRACEYCLSHDGECIQEDDMAELVPHIMEADAVVLATPLYYSGMSAQLKTVIDRFFAFDGAIRKRRRKSSLLAACGDDAAQAMDALTAHYGAVCDYLNWENCGTVYALGASTRQAMEGSNFPMQAEKLGKSL